MFCLKWFLTLKFNPTRAYGSYESYAQRGSRCLDGRSGKIESEILSHNFFKQKKLAKWYSANTISVLEHRKCALFSPRCFWIPSKTFGSSVVAALEGQRRNMRWCFLRLIMLKIIMIQIRNSSAYELNGRKVFGFRFWNHIVTFFASKALT